MKFLWTHKTLLFELFLFSFETWVFLEFLGAVFVARELSEISVAFVIMRSSREANIILSRTFYMWGITTTTTLMEPKMHVWTQFHVVRSVNHEINTR
jgi:hypothetical protein